MNTPYIPPPYRPHIFPRVVRWTLVLLGCVLFLVISIGLMWEISALVD